MSAHHISSALVGDVSTPVMWSQHSRLGRRQHITSVHHWLETSAHLSRGVGTVDLGDVSTSHQLSIGWRRQHTCHMESAQLTWETSAYHISSALVGDVSTPVTWSQHSRLGRGQHITSAQHWLEMSAHLSWIVLPNCSKLSWIRGVT